MRALMRKPIVLWICVMVLIAASAVNGQVLYGSLTGLVIDPSSAVIPNAKVEALEVNTGLSRQTVTDSRGAYVFTNIPSGTYNVKVSASGFQPTAESGIVVTANEVRRADLKVQISTSTEVVE